MLSLDASRPPNAFSLSVAGSARPAAVPKVTFLPPKAHISTPARPALIGRGSGSAASPTKIAKAAADARTADARARKDAYSEMIESAEERGHMLDGLSETLGKMTARAEDMVKETQRVAQKETAKATARSFFRF